MLKPRLMRWGKEYTFISYSPHVNAVLAYWTRYLFKKVGHNNYLYRSNSTQNEQSFQRATGGRRCQMVRRRPDQYDSYFPRSLGRARPVSVTSCYRKRSPKLLFFITIDACRKRCEAVIYSRDSYHFHTWLRCW